MEEQNEKKIELNDATLNENGNSKLSSMPILWYVLASVLGIIFIIGLINGLTEPSKFHRKIFVFRAFSYLAMSLALWMLGRLSSGNVTLKKRLEPNAPTEKKSSPAEIICYVAAGIVFFFTICYYMVQSEDNYYRYSWFRDELFSRLFAILSIAVSIFCLGYSIKLNNRFKSLQFHTTGQENKSVFLTSVLSWVVFIIGAAGTIGCGIWFFSNFDHWDDTLGGYGSQRLSMPLSWFAFAVVVMIYGIVHDRKSRMKNLQQ